MSVASERLAAAKSRLDEISREHADRRELRERRSREAKEKAADSFSKQGRSRRRSSSASRRPKRAEGRRRWGTQAATEKKPGEFRFGTEDEEPTYEAPAPGNTWTTPAPTPRPRRSRGAARPAAPAAARGEAGSRRPAPVDDDEDFGGQSWLTWARRPRSTEDRGRRAQRRTSGPRW
ncbi:hypothetical protein K7G98_20040 [Saccharothrix sp. MB29]|nr:hypothetical protein [Saccharothrix sp. MB29]